MPPAPGRSSSPRPGWEEVTLIDLLALVHRRRRLVAMSIGLGLLAGVAATVLSTPVYEAQASIVALEHQHVLETWLQSQAAAEEVLRQSGPLLQRFLEAEAGAAAEPATPGILAGLLTEHVALFIGPAGEGGRILEIRTSFADPALARDVAGAYLESLVFLRPQLENITRNDLFLQFYKGDNSEEARRQASEVATQKLYWMVVEEPQLPRSPAEPRPAINMLLGILGGAFTGLLGVVLADAWRNTPRGVEGPMAGPGSLPPQGDQRTGIPAENRRLR